MGGAVFTECSFQDCTFRGTQFQVILTDCIFRKCNLDMANMSTAIITNTFFVSCRMEYTVLSRATMLNGGIMKTALHGSYLDMAETENVNFEGELGVVIGCAGKAAG